MKIHRFINPAFNLDEKQLNITDPEILNQWVNVLRFKVGEQVILCDGSGYEALATIEKVSDGEVLVNISDKHENLIQKKANLYCAILKKENFELVVQKAVEVGVNKIIPISTERTIKQNLKFDRLEKIIKEASEQCGRAVVPVISEITTFEDSVAAVSDGENYLFDLSSAEQFSKQNKGAEINLFVGPEGGFTEKEVEFAKNAGFKIVSLGNLVLRGETAAIVAAWAGVNL